MKNSASKCHQRPFWVECLVASSLKTLSTLFLLACSPNAADELGLSSSDGGVNVDRFVDDSSVGRTLFPPSLSQGRIEFLPYSLAQVRALTAGLSTHLSDGALSNYEITITGIEVATASDSPWVPLYRSEEGFKVDLIAGTMMGRTRIGFVTDPGTYRFLYVRMKAEASYSRGSSCVGRSVAFGDQSSFGGIVTSIGEALSRGQDLSAADLTSWVPDPGEGPESLHDDINQGFFWVMARPFTISEARVTSLYLSLLPLSEMVDPASCDTAPRAPFLFMGFASELKDALNEVNTSALQVGNTIRIGSCTDRPSNRCSDHYAANPLAAIAVESTCVGTWVTEECLATGRLGTCKLVAHEDGQTISYYQPMSLGSAQTACSDSGGAFRPD